MPFSRLYKVAQSEIMNKLKLITFRGVVGVRYCTASMAVQVKRKYGPLKVQRSQLMNGIAIAAAKPLGCAQIGACTIMFRAGSRYEEDDMIGASHFLRVMSSCSSDRYTAFIKMRTLQQQGAYLSVTSDRQTISYTLRCPPPLFCDLKYFLLDTATRCCFHRWEFDERRQIVKEDLERIHPEQRVIDLVQKALWSGPLSNSVFCPEGRIHEFTEDCANMFVQKHFRSDGCSIGSTGFDFEDVLKLSEKIQPVREKPPTPRTLNLSCPRGGFETYDLGACSTTYIALGVPSTGTNDMCSLLKHSIVASACGTGPVQRGEHTISGTPQTPLSIVAGLDPATYYKAFNISYLETGVFGIVARARAVNGRCVAQAAAEFLTNVGELDDCQIQVGKNRLKLAMCINDDDCMLASQGLALQAANFVQLNSAQDAMDMIDRIPIAEIKQTAREIGQKSRSMAVAVVGDITAVPHDRELVCGI